MSKKLFITGTGTEVGKTYAAALLVKKLKESGRSAAYYKAAMSGNERREDGTLIPGDALYVKETSGILQPLDKMCPYVYEAAVSPHLAARLEGHPMELETVKKHFDSLMSTYDYITVEGSGGILCPLRYDQVKIKLEDVIRKLDLACLIVADAGLGTINQVCLTADYMRAGQIPVKGIILNHFHPGNVMEQDNKSMCEQLTGLRVLTCIEEGETELKLPADELAALYD